MLAKQNICNTVFEHSNIEILRKADINQFTSQAGNCGLCFAQSNLRVKTFLDFNMKTSTSWGDEYLLHISAGNSYSNSWIFENPNH